MNKKILICDDEEGIRESLKLILSDYYNLIVTEGGPQALDILGKNDDIGLLLLDIKMPKIHGLDILKQAKEKNPDLKVVMITGYKSVETASEAARLGASGYIVKPFDTQQILETVQKIFPSQSQ